MLVLGCVDVRGWFEIVICPIGWFFSGGGIEQCSCGMCMCAFVCVCVVWRELVEGRTGFALTEYPSLLARYGVWCP